MPLKLINQINIWTKITNCLLKIASFSDNSTGLSSVDDDVSRGVTFVFSFDGGDILTYLFRCEKKISLSNLLLFDRHDNQSHNLTMALLSDLFDKARKSITRKLSFYLELLYRKLILKKKTLDIYRTFYEKRKQKKNVLS